MAANFATPAFVERWHEVVRQSDAKALRALIGDNAVFCSPAVHTPQEGPEVTFAYLWAAFNVLGPTLTYVDEWYGENSAVLRFRCEVDGLNVEGVDIIEWDEHDQIVKFTVMVRPFKALQAVIAQVGVALQS